MVWHLSSRVISRVLRNISFELVLLGPLSELAWRFSVSNCRGFPLREDHFKNLLDSGRI